MDKAILVILDGFGKGKKDNTDATYLADTKYIDSLYHNYPNSNMYTHGLNVGLPEGQMGNSEVGHLNIGAGRVVYQDFTRINVACESGEMEKNENLLRAIDYAKVNNKKIHLFGLHSKGGIHSHENHLKKICEIIDNENVKNVFVHSITDGRDCDPFSFQTDLLEFEQFLVDKDIKLASVIGRYYAMDRDKRWERIKIAYDLYTKGFGDKSSNIYESIKNSYKNGITDEFIKPIIKVDENNKPLAIIEEEDVVICYNFRTDRCREITIALTQEDLEEYGMKAIKLNYFTMTRYDKNYKNISVFYEKDNLKNTIGEVISNNGLTQLRIAETEKYPHVTFFMSGGKEELFDNEKRILVSSPKVATYDLQPEMSAIEITDKVVYDINNSQPDFICLNFANCDMVGHTGVQSAIIKAIETIDNCLQKVVEAAKNMNYHILVTADHGNSELNYNEDGSIHTAHTTNLVPIFLISDKYKNIKDGKLCDIAPTILQMIGIEQPEEMTGESMIV